MAKRSKIGIPLIDSKAVFTVQYRSIIHTYTPIINKNTYMYNVLAQVLLVTYFISGNQKLLAVNRVTSPCYI